MESLDLEKFNVDYELQSISDAMTITGLNFCGGVFEHLDTGEEFTLTIAKRSSIRDIDEINQKLVKENVELRKQLKDSHEWLGISAGYKDSPLCVNNEKLLNK